MNDFFIPGDFTKDLVSVILPTYKRNAFLATAIKSLLAQSYQKFEVLVVDDEPSRATEILVKNFQDKRLKYIANQIHGRSSARNIGISSWKH
jgi:glycosyltransferase involved in cell wall biosynthesis